MPEFDIVFEMLKVAVAEENQHHHPDEQSHLAGDELDEIEELRRYAAEMQEPELTSFTIT